MQDFNSFFQKVTGQSAWPFQERFHLKPTRYTALIVPTGMGKTQTVLADWLLRRPTTRLLWVLPGRALTAQVAKVARTMVAASGFSVAVIELMGGSDEDLEMMLRPDQPAILVATLDIAVSRALNRGYARSPFRWPMDFALLNNDVQWVLDEVQLQSDALATSTQLAAFRDRFGTFGSTPCVWISATFDPAWLKTVDFGDKAVRRVQLDENDKSVELVVERLGAAKKLAGAPEECRTAKGMAEFIRREHRAGTLTLAIVNTVQRAREVYEELKKLEPVLLHSRFRPSDRRAQMERLLTLRDGIVVSTQVIEAGIDLDGDLLITDPAPWASMIQRFGRINRYGLRGSSRIFWVDRPTKKDKKFRKPEEDFAPYDPKDVEFAITELTKLVSAAPADLPEEKHGKTPYENVLREADLRDLFDTTPDLAGNQVDVSRFVRSGDDTDVYFAWRDWPAKQLPDRLPAMEDREFCPIPIGQAKDFLKGKSPFVWQSGKQGKWERPDAIYPGIRLLLKANEGGYVPSIGWQPDSKVRVQPVDVGKSVTEENESADIDNSSGKFLGGITLAAHTEHVVAEAKQILESLTAIGVGEFAHIMETAAQFHDWGKAHQVFQDTMHRAGLGADVLWAKSPGKGKHNQPHFRHELASALAMIESGVPDLAAYLVAAHHGKVRMNIRSMPGEESLPDRRMARGIKEGDSLPNLHFGGAVTLSLAISELGIAEDGRLGWTARADRLLREYGPFRLAFLELILRSADETASARERSGQ